MFILLQRSDVTRLALHEYLIKSDIPYHYSAGLSDNFMGKHFQILILSSTVSIQVTSHTLLLKEGVFNKPENTSLATSPREK